MRYDGKIDATIPTDPIVNSNKLFSKVFPCFRYIILFDFKEE